MILNKKKPSQLLLLLLVELNALSARSEPYKHSSNPSSFLKQAHAIIQFGGHWSTQGQRQHINIQDLIGDEFTVTHRGSNNGLIGFGYYLAGQDQSFLKVTYGINAFYLAQTSVKGYVIQENLFTNLSYQYNLTHYPFYALARSNIVTSSPGYELTIDAGIGPNFLKLNKFLEGSLDGITIPDHIFSNHTSTVFSATTGLGLKINHFFGQMPLEFGYRFFYLGQGNFNKANSQVLNSLGTGAIFANALICSIII